MIMMKYAAFLTLIAVCGAHAQSRSDSALVGRILLAEDRRDSSDAALVEGLRSSDARISAIARRAMWRIRDPKFTNRDSLPSLAAPTTWPEQAWRLRFRALTNKSDCATLASALNDSTWFVRFRGMDLMTPSCSSETVAIASMKQWIDALPANTGTHKSGMVSWHGAAHAIVALAKTSPADARSRAKKLATHSQWEVRMYAARAMAVLADTAGLRTLVKDRDDNVKEAAIDALAKLTAHANDAVYATALNANGAQAVRAAAIALKGTSDPTVRSKLATTLDKWTAKNVASARDARVALLEALGRPASDDKPPMRTIELPRNAVALALGADKRLKVTLSPASGGGSFIVRLRGDNAPIMAARILDLAESKYYDKGNWHRVEHDFVIQGAGPGTNEYVGANDYLRDELGNVSHVRGTIGMSTRGHDNGDAQWFINLRDNPRLTRDYTVFAEVVEGMDVVDNILEGDVVQSIRVVKR